jgi:hypothetical protein
MGDNIIFWLGSLKGRDHLEDHVLRKQGGKVWTGFIWLRIGASGRLV